MFETVMTENLSKLISDTKPQIQEVQRTSLMVNTKEKRLKSFDMGFPGGASGARLEFDPWVGKIPWRREWQPTPVFLPGESHGVLQTTGHGIAKSQTQLSHSHDRHTPCATSADVRDEKGK